MINSSRALSGRMNLFGVNTQGIVRQHDALGFVLAALQAADRRLNEPPESSPGMSGAIPWVNVPQNILRPEGAQEA
jgi:hypothetical protein